jgi:transketolase
MSTGTSPITDNGSTLSRAVLDVRSIELRKTVVQIFKSSRRGHVPSAFSLIEILRVLYDRVLRYDPKNPRWHGRDRCILSKGHGCLALYVILADKGFFPRSELWRFCTSQGILGGHPEAGKVPGVEASTGSLGHGLPIGIGFALNARFEKSDHRTFVIIGDGEADEGSNWEAAMCAGKHKLANLTVIVDYNKCQSYDYTCMVQDLEPFADKWTAFGFSVTEVDGHDVGALSRVFASLPLHPDKPNAIICHTVKGKGVASIENDLSWHHKSKISDEELSSLMKGLGVD